MTIQEANNHIFLQVESRKTKEVSTISKPLFPFVGGPDETRTRDPMRDRHVF